MMSRKIFYKITINGEFDRLETEVSELDDTTADHKQRLIEQELKLDEKEKRLVIQEERLIALEQKYTEKLNALNNMLATHERRLTTVEQHPCLDRCWH